jgi:hypothetical protein
MDRDARRRAWVGFAALAFGSAAFYWSMDRVAVTLHRQTSPGNWVGGEFSGWECATRYAPAYAANLSLAAAPILWFVALWLRSPWARTIGAGACCAATVVQATIPFVAEREGVLAFGDGFMLWVESSVLLTMAFAALAEPERPPPGEGLSRESVLAARRWFALLFGALGTAFVVTSQFGFSAYVPGFYNAGIQVKRPPDVFERPAAFVAMLEPTEALLATALLALPLVFAATWTTRSPRLRALGVAGVVGVVLAQVLVRPAGYWWWWSGCVHPACVHWYGGPAALLVAFLLLPLLPRAPGRRGRPRNAESRVASEPFAR